MAFRSGDTIVALSSGRLPAGLAVIRISGPRARFAVETIAGDVPLPRRAVLRDFRAVDGAIVDRGIALFFSGPAGFTGEDCAELHCHGGRAVVASLLASLCALPSIRLAEPGEFTRRAFLNGKVDLTQAEALADLIAAETEAQRRVAARAASGALRELYDSWRVRLIHARAMIEAELDFSDEADVPGSVADEVIDDVLALRNEVSRHVDGYRAAEIIREGYDVVIVGAPNVGKSSLLNALAGRPAAIVSDEPGTTRDLVEVALDLSGLKVRLTDTAGIREGAGKVEQIGIDRARMRMEEADLVLRLLEAGSDPGDGMAAGSGPEQLVVGTKADLVSGQDRGGFDHVISTVTGAGLDELLADLRVRAETATSSSVDLVPLRVRQTELLRQAGSEMDEALSSGDDRTLYAEHLRLASDALGRIVGRVHVEDLLDVIFSQFCIGK